MRPAFGAPTCRCWALRTCHIDDAWGTQGERVPWIMCVCVWDGAVRCAECSFELIGTQIMVFINPFCTVLVSFTLLWPLFCAQNKLVKNAQRQRLNCKEDDDERIAIAYGRVGYELALNTCIGHFVFFYLSSFYCCRIKIYDKSSADYVQS